MINKKGRANQGTARPCSLLSDLENLDLALLHLHTPKPANPDPSRSREAGSGTLGTEASTGPVLPVVLLKISATKTLPRLFGAVRSAIVALATWNIISVLKALDAPLPHVVQLIPKPKFPVPSPLKAPASAAKVWPTAF